MPRTRSTTAPRRPERSWERSTVNQTKAPVGTADGSSQFQELGVFFPTLSSSGDGTLTVVLNASSANGTVVADAVGAAQAWASTGGPAPFESEPSYQLAVPEHRDTGRLPTCRSTRARIAA